MNKLKELEEDNEILRKNNRELGEQRHALMEEVIVLRTVLNNVRYYLKVSIDDSYSRLNKINGLTATEPKDEEK
jgi:hypothetical protein